MKRIKELIKLNFPPFVLCLGIIIAFQSPGRPIQLLDILIGVIISYYGGMAIFTHNSKS
jgi:hypothetical protein